MKIPAPITRLIESFERLPGIGPKTAQRLVFHLLHFPDYEINKFANSLNELKSGVKFCTKCKNVSEDDICYICSNENTDKSLLLVVASPLDVFAYSKTNYNGLFHVLHGLIDPLNNIGPDEIFVNELLDRVLQIIVDENRDLEIILSTNMSMEGESTAMYLARALRELNLDQSRLKISRIARGLPVGGDIEYADDITLSRALEGRNTF